MITYRYDIQYNTLYCAQCGDVPLATLTYIALGRLPMCQVSRATDRPDPMLTVAALLAIAVEW